MPRSRTFGKSSRKRVLSRKKGLEKIRRLREISRNSSDISEVHSEETDCSTSNNNDLEISYTIEVKEIEQTQPEPSTSKFRPTDTPTQLPRPRAPRKIPQITPNCPQCYADLPMTTIARDERVRLVIAKVYQFLEEEYDELKCIYPNTDLFMLSEFSRRTAAATGVTEDLVQEILGEEAVRSAAAEPPPAKRARTAEDGTIDDDVDDVEGNMYIDDNDEQTEEIVQVMKGPSVYMNKVPMLEIKPLIGFEEETLIIKEETEMDTMDVPKQEPPDELHSEYINVNNTATDVTSDEIVRRDKQKTISEPTGHVSTTYVYNRVTDVSIDEIVRRDKQKTTSEPTGHVSTEDPLLITEVKQEDLDIKEEGIS